MTLLGVFTLLISHEIHLSESQGQVVSVLAALREEAAGAGRGEPEDKTAENNAEASRPPALDISTKLSLRFKYRFCRKFVIFSTYGCFMAGNISCYK